jgi:hypothetical protein
VRVKGPRRKSRAIDHRIHVLPERAGRCKWPSAPLQRAADVPSPPCAEKHAAPRVEPWRSLVPAIEGLARSPLDPELAFCGGLRASYCSDISRPRSRER